jgi:hypothetical protein
MRAGFGRAPTSTRAEVIRIIVALGGNALLRHPNSGMVAGVGFEPTTFRL